MPKFFLPLTLLLLSSLAPAQGAEGWGTDYRRAQAEARQKRRPILLAVTGSDWCGPCIHLKKTTFDSPEFKKWSKQRVVLALADFPRRTKLPAKLKAQNDALAKRYKVTGYPTVLVVDHKGTLLGQIHLLQKDTKGKWLGRAEGLIRARFNPISGLALRKGEKPPLPRRRADPVKARPPSKPKKDAGAANGKGWYLDPAEAIDEASRTKRTVLALFTCSDRGSASKALHKILVSPEFKSWADKSLVLLEVDFPVRKRQSPRLKLRNVKLKGEHSVRDLPEVLFLSADGKVVARLSSTKGSPATWVKQAKAKLAAR